MWPKPKETPQNKNIISGCNKHKKACRIKNSPNRKVGPFVSFLITIQANP